MNAVSTTPASSETFVGYPRIARLAAVLKRWWMAYLTWRLERTVITQLRALSDLELKDMGLSRCAIDDAVRRKPISEYVFNPRW